MISKNFKNILLIQLGDIGDVVLTTSTIRAVKENFPKAHITIMVRKPFGSLLVADPHLYECLEFEKYRGALLDVFRGYFGFSLRLRRARYDLVIELRTGDRGAFLSFLTGAKVRVGRHAGKSYFWHKLLFTKIVTDLSVAPPPVHPGADQSLRVISKIGMFTDNSLPKLYIASKDRESAVKLLAECRLEANDTFVTINPFSRWKYKEWDNGKWQQVIKWLWDSYRIPSVLIGSPDEAEDAESIVQAVEGCAYNLAGKTTLGSLAAVISMSSLHMGVDSAAPHIAAALETPTITIHGPTDWRAWRIVDDLHKIICPDMDCVPCSQMGCDDSERSRCLDSLCVEPVIQLALEILQGVGKT